jgi:shikimate dehydrogenase
MITSSTKLYCVLGNPVSHSKSPLVHNISFRANNIDAVYLAFEPQDIAMAIKALKTFKIKGASITIPFKETIMPYLDWIEPRAKEIGAVNTVVNQDGKLLGYNTDSKAAIDPLVPHGIKNKTVCIIGAGGAARAVAHGITDKKGQLIIINRSREKGAALAAEFNAQFIPFDKMDKTGKMDFIAPDVVINTTSLGMYPHVEALAFPSQCLTPGMVVMDLVYTPLETRLLSVARKNGCITIDGLSMFIAQAAAQFELWTNVKPDTNLMRQAVLENPF